MFVVWDSLGKSLLHGRQQGVEVKGWEMDGPAVTEVCRKAFFGGRDH